MIYITAIFVGTLIAYYISTDKTIKAKDAQIQDLNDRLAARNHDEYVRMKQPVSTKEVEYEERKSYFDDIRVREPKEV